MKYKEEILCTLSCAKNKVHLIYFDEITRKIMKNMPNKNIQFVRKQLEKIDDNFIDYVYYLE